jgi:thiamine-monophosphate kinase
MSGAPRGSELARVELLRGIFGGRLPGDVLLGIGDDCAVLRGSDEPLVWTIDAAVENVHFRRDLMSLEDLGFRATMAAASDLAAMGARPLGLLAGLGLPAWVTDDDLAAIARGQRAAADALGTALVGGNLARAGELTITTTALGTAERPFPRGGARAGDAIFLAGPVGLAGAGFRLLDARRPVESEAAHAAVAAFRRPVARIEAGLSARTYADAAIDVSDGLARDLAHVAIASGVTAVLDPQTLSSPELVAVAAELGEDPVELALHGGEDYAVVVVAPPSARLPGFVRIGGCEPRDDSLGPVALCDAAGARTRVAPRGFDHFG